MGGEEFCLLLTETDIKGAMAEAESVRSPDRRPADPPRRQRNGSGDGELRTGRCHARESGTPQDLIKAAKKALTKQKERGRNQIVCGRAISTEESIDNDSMRAATSANLHNRHVYVEPHCRKRRSPAAKTRS